MKKDSAILIIGHNDVIERSLFRHFNAAGFTKVFSSSDIALNTTIQSSVYDFFARNRPEYVFLGSTRSGGIQANLDRPAEFMYHNLETQNNILYAAQKFRSKKLLFYSASCVYPKDCPQPMKEEYVSAGPMEETSEPYSLAKLAGIRLCQSFRKQYGFNAVVMIPATVYGPECDMDLSSAHVLGALIGKFAEAVKENKPEVTVWGSGAPRREFLFVDDFVRASLFLMERYDGGDFVNAGSGGDISVRELAEMIASISGFKGKLVFDTSKPDGTRQKLLDSSRVNSSGWRPEVGLREGIEKTFNWYLSSIR